MREPLEFRYTTTHKDEPLCVVKNFPGIDAEMTPEQLRDMALQLIQASIVCELQNRMVGGTLGERVGTHCPVCQGLGVVTAELLRKEDR